MYVHEQSLDQRVLHAILTASHHIHHLTQAKRKHYLYSLLSEHGIWHSDGGLWRDLIEEVVAVKVQEAVRRKARKEALTATVQQQS